MLSAYQVVGAYAAPWGDQAFVYGEQDLSCVVYDGMVLRERSTSRR